MKKLLISFSILSKKSFKNTMHPHSRKKKLVHQNSNSKKSSNKKSSRHHRDVSTPSIQPSSSQPSSSQPSSSQIPHQNGRLVLSDISSCSGPSSSQTPTISNSVFQRTFIIQGVVVASDQDLQKHFFVDSSSIPSSLPFSARYISAIPDLHWLKMKLSKKIRALSVSHQWPISLMTLRRIQSNKCHNLRFEIVFPYSDLDVSFTEIWESLINSSKLLAGLSWDPKAVPTNYYRSLPSDLQYFTDSMSHFGHGFLLTFQPLAPFPIHFDRVKIRISPRIAFCSKNRQLHLFLAIFVDIPPNKTLYRTTIIPHYCNSEETPTPPSYYESLDQNDAGQTKYSATRSFSFSAVANPLSLVNLALSAGLSLNKEETKPNVKVSQKSSKKKPKTSKFSVPAPQLDPDSDYDFPVWELSKRKKISTNYHSQASYYFTWSSIQDFDPSQLFLLLDIRSKSSRFVFSSNMSFSIDPESRNPPHCTIGLIGNPQVGKSSFIKSVIDPHWDRRSPTNELKTRLSHLKIKGHDVSCRTIDTRGYAFDMNKLDDRLLLQMFIQGLDSTTKFKFDILRSEPLSLDSLNQPDCIVIVANVIELLSGVYGLWMLPGEIHLDRPCFFDWSDLYIKNSFPAGTDIYDSFSSRILDSCPWFTSSCSSLKGLISAVVFALANYGCTSIDEAKKRVFVCLTHMDLLPADIKDKFSSYFSDQHQKTTGLNPSQIFSAEQHCKIPFPMVVLHQKHLHDLLKNTLYHHRDYDDFRKEFVKLISGLIVEVPDQHGNLQPKKLYPSGFSLGLQCCQEKGCAHLYTVTRNQEPVPVDDFFHALGYLS